ncbi:MAG: Lrp/AsnC family transcriptional regulator [Chthoniobacteraceae bacterium]
MRELDEQERLIVRHLIRDPRESDNGIGEATGVNVRTVGRKRQKLEQAGILSYFTHLDLSSHGTGQFSARHLYIIQFRIGVTYKQLLEDIQREPSVRSVFTKIIFESHIAEIDGKLAMLLFIDGASDTDIVQTVQEELIPSLLKNHGADSIEEVQTIRVLAPVRVMRNYVLPVNMEAGYIKKDWPADGIYVGPNPPPDQGAE